MYWRLLLALLILNMVTANSAEAGMPDHGLLLREAILEKSFATSARAFGIPPQLVKAIARQESSCRPLVVNIAGKDYYPKTLEYALKLCEIAEESQLQYDVGLMQINRYWIHKYRIPVRVLFNPADNIHMGCFILNNEIRKHGLNWKAVGRYHSRTAWRAKNYVSKIKRHLANILASK